MERDRLFVGQRQDEVSTGPILHTEDLRNRQAARCLPELGGSEDGHQHLLAADRVHLLADDLLDLPVDAPAERCERPEARRDLADEASADEQLVAHRFGIARILPEGRDEELGGSHRLCYDGRWAASAMRSAAGFASLSRFGRSMPPAIHVSISWKSSSTRMSEETFFSTRPWA